MSDWKTPEWDGMLHHRKFSLRSTDVAARLDTFLVCAIAAVLGNRFFLVLTGYPQLGKGTLHISHAIWGALTIAPIIYITFVVGPRPPARRSRVALRLPRSRVSALGWFERGLLVEILVTQVFVFQQRQLGALLGLEWTIVVWLLVRSAMRAERERESLGIPEAPPDSAHSAATTAQAVS